MKDILNSTLELTELMDFLNSDQKIHISDATYKKVSCCHDYLKKKIYASDELIYGINTGFGSLCNVRIDEKALEQLQENLVRSHACGMGDLVPEVISRNILFLKIKSLSIGHSGVSPELLSRLINMYNEGIFPVMYQLGSLGASGDLAPLAHLSLPLIGEGQVYYKGKICSSSSVLKEKGWSVLKLKPKEGLALLNGTQFSTGYGLWSLIKAVKLSKWADVIAAISLDAFACSLAPFNSLLHKIRAHAGQIKTAEYLLELLEGSSIHGSPLRSVQDPYAFRCIPQVHGATKDTISHVQRVLETEMNSVTDNPNVFPDEDEILSGGNFHAQPVALVLDFLAIAIAELGSISERRVYQLISGQRGLPPFLTAQSGLHSGLMITQYTAASIVSQNKQLCTPSSVDSIVSCNGQEDHVSMAANAATKLHKVVNNVQRLLAIELVATTQAINFRKGQTSDLLERLIKDFRKEVSFNEYDRIMHEDLTAAEQFIESYDILRF